MPKQTIDVNLLTKTPYIGVLDSDLAVIYQTIARNANARQYQTYDGTDDLQLPDTMTIQDVFAKMVPSSMLIFEALAGTYVNLDLPIHPLDGARASGRIMFIAANSSTNKQTAYFQNQRGAWQRSFNTLAGVGDQDTGWQLVLDGNYIPSIAAGTMSSRYSNLSANIIYAGRVYFTNSLAATISDLPTTGAGILTITKLSGTSETIQTYTTWAGLGSYSRSISTGGVAAPWVKTAVSNDVFTTSGRITAAGFTSTSSSVMGTITPTTTAAFNLGSASLTWNNIYTQNAVTVVSDRNYKTDIGSIPDEVLDAWSKIKYSQWKMNAAVALKGEEARLHVGIVAQDIKETFEAEGLDATEYGILIHDSWSASPAVEYKAPVYDEETDELLEPEVEASPAREAGEIWMVRMEECLALEAALMRRTQERLEARLAALEVKPTE